MILRSFIIFIIIGLNIGSFSVMAAPKSPAQLYQSECSDCHVAYPSMLLSTASWDAVLSSLDKHFGENAELDASDLHVIKKYLDSHNYDQSRIKRRYNGRFDTLGTPLRATKTRFFKSLHHEVSDRLVSGNPKVKTFARCEACHAGAENGDFDEDDVRIPR